MLNTKPSVQLSDDVKYDVDYSDDGDDEHGEDD